MAEVVVDMKPMAKLPYDPETIPEAVRKRAAAVDALYGSTALASGTVTVQQTNGSDANGQRASEVSEPPPPEAVPITPQEPVQPVQQAPTPASSVPAEPVSPPHEGDDQNWRRQALAWEGRYKATTKTVAEMQEQMVQLGNELLHAQRLIQSRSASQQPAVSQPPPSYLTEQDVQNYGGELADFAQRAALHVVAPHLQNLESQNAELRQALAKEARRALDQAVELAVPDYREIDRNPRWHRWLLGIDLFTGRVRQQLLNEAIAAASASRVISFFRGFLAEEVATGNIESASGSLQAAPPREPAVILASLASPGRARPATGADTQLPPDKPIYTHANIRDLYSARRKGEFAGRDAEWNRIEADIFLAQREGRVR